MARIIQDDIETIMKRWAPIVEAGSEKITSNSIKKSVSQLLENTAREFAKAGLLMEDRAPGMTAGAPGALAGSAGQYPIQGKTSKGYLKGAFGRDAVKDADTYGDYYLPNVIMPMVRRIFPSLIAHELVGVQALNGPIGYALAYRAKYNDNGGLGLGYGKLDLSDREIGFNPTDTRYTGEAEITALTSLTATQNTVVDGDLPDGYPDFASKAWESYVGKEPGKNGSLAWAGEGKSIGVESEYARFSTGTYPTVSFDFLKTMVEAKTRKLGAGWSPELAEDMEAIHNFDVESEFVNIITYEIGAEIDRQIVTEMVKTAIVGGSISGWNPAYADGLDQMGRLQTLLVQINLEANQIALKTRRGHANFVVTSPVVCSLLESLSMNKFVSFQNTNKAPTVPDAGVGALTKIGLINDGQQLLVRDVYAAGNYLVMGYKGSNPADNGIIYCPYVPVQLQKVIDPDTLTPRIGARTRYGIMNSVWDAKNYYHYIVIDGLTQAYEWSSGQRQFVQPYSKVTNGTLFV
jgi:hypothetical protein